jgi:hypothetical protein
VALNRLMSPAATDGTLYRFSRPGVAHKGLGRTGRRKQRGPDQRRDPARCCRTVEGGTNDNSVRPGTVLRKTLLGKPLAPSQWAACWKYGWDEPTTTIARIGHDFGHDVLLALLVLAVMVFLLIRSTS